MPLEQAGSAATETADNRTETPKTPLKVSLGDIMAAGRVPMEVQESMHKIHSEEPKVEEQPELPEQEQQEQQEADIPQEVEQQQPEEVPAEEPAEAEVAAAPEGYKLPKWVQPRIDKLTRRFKDEESRRVQLEQQLKEVSDRLANLDQVVVQGDQNNPLAGYTTPEELARVEQEAEAYKEWATVGLAKVTDIKVGEDENGNPRYVRGVLVDQGKASQRIIPPEEFAATQSNSDRMLRVLLPKKRFELSRKVQFDQAAKEIMPDLFNPYSPIHSAAQQILKEIPSLISHPAKNYFLSVALTGFGFINQTAQTGKGKVSSKVQNLIAPRPPIAPGVPGTPSRQRESVQKSSQVQEQLKKMVESGGDLRSAAEAIKAIWASREQPRVPGRKEKVAA